MLYKFRKWWRQQTGLPYSNFTFPFFRLTVAKTCHAAISAQNTLFIRDSQNFVFFYWRKVFFRVWLNTCQKIMSLWAREPPQTGGYGCIISIHLFTLSKLWGRFSQLQNRFLKRNRAQSVFMLQRWFAYENIVERIRNRSSALDFSFSSLFFFVIWTWSGISVEK